jgi:hypothetical protein
MIDLALSFCIFNTKFARSANSYVFSWNKGMIN